MARDDGTREGRRRSVGGEFGEAIEIEPDDLEEPVGEHPQVSFLDDDEEVDSFAGEAFAALFMSGPADDVAEPAPNPPAAGAGPGVVRLREPERAQADPAEMAESGQAIDDQVDEGPVETESASAVTQTATPVTPVCPSPDAPLESRVVLASQRRITTPESSERNERLAEELASIKGQNERLVKEKRQLAKELEQASALADQAVSSTSGSTREVLELRGTLNRKERELLQLRDQQSELQKTLLEERDGSLVDTECRDKGRNHPVDARYPDSGLPHVCRASRDGQRHGHRRGRRPANVGHVLPPFGCFLLAVLSHYHKPQRPHRRHLEHDPLHRADRHAPAGGLCRRPHRADDHHNIVINRWRCSYDLAGGAGL